MMTKATAKAKKFAVQFTDQEYVGWVCTNCDEMEEGKLPRPSTPCPACGEASLGDKDIRVFETAASWAKASAQVKKDTKRTPGGAQRTGKSDRALKAKSSTTTKKAKFGEWWDSIGSARRKELLRAHGSHGDGGASTDDKHQTGEDHAKAQIREKYESGTIS